MLKRDTVYILCLICSIIHIYPQEINMGGFLEEEGSLEEINLEEVEEKLVRISDLVTTLTIKPINNMIQIYNDKGTGTTISISVWRADLSYHPNYYSLGDVAMDSYEQPATIYIVSAEEDELMPPVDYIQVWNDAGSGGDQDGSFWQPVAPDGYVCLGHIAQNGYDKPSTDLMRCVKSSLVRPATTWKLWDDTGSGADEDVAIWEVIPNVDDPRGVTMNLFISVDNYGDSGSNYMVLDRDTIKSGSFLRYNINLDTPFLFAPLIYMHPEEKYFPDSPIDFLKNVHTETIDGESFLTTNEPLGCSDCTDPIFLYGKNPGENDVPVFAMIINRAINGQPVVDFLYWTFYPYNRGKEVLDVKTYGNHVGDWEYVAVRLIDGYASKVFYSFHDSGWEFNWGNKQIGMIGDNHFVAYSAEGSHGYYPSSGTFDYRCDLAMGGIYDETGRGAEWDTWKDLVPFYLKEKGKYTGQVEFLNRPERWGNHQEDCDITKQCILENGPQGPTEKGAVDLKNIYFGLSSEADVAPKKSLIECLLHMYGRGVGKPISTCHEDEEKDGLLCYPYCDAGYTGVGPVCWQDCPSGFRDDGAFCAKPAPYGRGAGYPIWGESDCNNDHPQGCERYGLLYYPKCDPGYYAFGCCICSPDCLNGQTDIGVSCAKKSYGRGAGSPMTCEAGYELSGALCYPLCKPGFTGVGPICSNY